MKTARETAIKKNKKIKVVWRHYSTSVEPTQQEFSVEDLRDELLKALKEIQQIHQIPNFEGEEEKVSFF